MTLSKTELRIASGYLYTKFRGHFTDVTREISPDGATEVIVWGKCDKEPLFRIAKQDGRYVAHGGYGKSVLVADGLEELFDKLHTIYPPMALV